MTCFFSSKGEEPPVWIPCDRLHNYYRTYFLFCSEVIYAWSGTLQLDAMITVGVV